VVLAKVFKKLQPLAPHLTVQVTKDDFGRSFGNLHILRDVNSPLTNITIGGSDLSPIPKTNELNNHLIYSTSSTYRDDLFKGQSRYPVPNLRFSDSSVHYPSQSRGSLSSTSSMYQNNNVPTQLTTGASDPHGNYLSSNPQLPATYAPQQPITSTTSSSSNTSNRPHTSPFVTNGNPSSSNSQALSQNLLISSANHFPDP
jgi:hypothetical protein